MTFVRAQAPRWHDEVPGARWFRADLHVHTLDDHPGGRIRWSGTGTDQSAATAYARELLRTAIRQGIEVLALTPHAVNVDQAETVSAVWTVVDVWNLGLDDDGVAFRDKIYAVFPGFEASMADGARGVHFAFLFDPEIDRDGLVRAFHTVMNGVVPWRGNQLNNAGRDAAEACEALANLARDDGGQWKWIALAPHAFARDRGLFALQSQILEHFKHEHIVGLELGDDQDENSVREGRAWLDDGMRKYHHAFYYASDAYVLNPDPASVATGQLGFRTTMVKLAEPRIEAIRQAFLASDSRMRLLHLRGAGAGGMISIPAPEAAPTRRSWLRALEVSGGTSFFGGADNGTPRTTTFRLNPDLTCVIGGRMSGKSTLLDGLRVAYDFPLPADPDVADDVRSRGETRFLSGGPTLTESIAGPADPTAELSERWPAVFFTQRELQQAVSDQGGLRDLLFSLLPGRAPELRAQYLAIGDSAKGIRRLVGRLGQASLEVQEAEQALATATRAQTALARYEQVGASRLSSVQADSGRLSAAAEAADSAVTSLAEVGESVAIMDIPAVETDRVRDAIGQAALEAAEHSLDELKVAVARAAAAGRAHGDALAAIDALGIAEVETFTRQVEADLVEAGGSADELNQFAVLSRRAQRHEESRLRLEQHQARLDEIRANLEAARVAKSEGLAAYRGSIAEVATAIERRFEGAIRVRTIQNGDTEGLDRWIHELAQRGVTRWWNDRSAPLAPEALVTALDSEALGELGMSPQVAETFAETMTEARRWSLLGVHTPDTYSLELRLANGTYRPMARLSGGQQVSLLLSLLLESDDPRPILIDQPEEELDKAYLFDSVLPALRRLKGQRQVVFVTHDANIVVNGDADQVIYLEAEADRGWVAAEGAIEQPDIRKAILTVLDGGPAAFELRSVKYGF